MASQLAGASSVGKSAKGTAKDTSRVVEQLTPTPVGTSQLTGRQGSVTRGVNNKIRPVNSPKPGKPSNLELLSKFPEKAQKSIQDFFVSVENKKKRKGVDEQNIDADDSLVDQRSPKIRKMSQNEEMLVDEQLKGVVLSQESTIILQKIAALSAQVKEAKEDHSTQLTNLEQTINSRFEEHNSRLEAVEKQITEWREEKVESNLLERVDTLEKHVNPENSPSNEYIVEWLSKVTDRLEYREREERKFNLIFRGLDMQTNNPKETIGAFLNTHFELKEVDEEIVKVSIGGREENQHYLVVVKSLEFKKQILKEKSKRLNKLPFFIDRDRTPLEREIGWRTRQLARTEVAQGHTTIVKDKKVQINGKWHSWEQKLGKFVLEPTTTKSDNFGRGSRNMSSKRSNTKGKLGREKAASLISK